MWKELAGLDALSDTGVTLVVHGITGGGAERVAVNMANHWAQVEREVTFVTFAIRDDECYRLDCRIKRVQLDGISLDDFEIFRWGKEEENIEKLRIALRAAGNKNVIAIMSMMSIRCLFADNTGQYNIFACEHCYPPYTVFSVFNIQLRELLYPKAKSVVVLTERGNKEWIQENIAGCDIAVIPNCITDSVVEEIGNCKESLADGQRYIFHCGRLTEQKSQDLLLRAFAKAIADNPEFDVRLKIAGTGELECELQGLAADLGIAEYVDFLGWRDDIYYLMKNALCFGLTSAYEGFGMVILESMVCGVPVVSFDCLAGPSEMIINGENGVLIEQGDVEGFSKALVKICSDVGFRDKLVRNTRCVQERFSQSKVMQMWDELIFSE